MSENRSSKHFLKRTIKDLSTIYYCGPVFGTLKLRKERQKILQICVNESQPAPVEKDLSIKDKNIQFTILKNDSVNF